MLDTLPTLNWIDYCCISCIGFSTIMSFSKGLVKELSSLANWIIAVWLGFFFYQPMSAQLPNIVQPQMVRFTLGFFTVFATILIVGTLLNNIISWIVNKTGLKGPDRVLGLFFGAARGAVLVSIAILFIHATPFAQSDAWQTSSLLPYFQPLEDWLHGFLTKPE